MIHIQNAKYVPLLTPGAAIATTATATASVDTLGYEYATIIVVRDSTTAATDNPSVLKIEESDTTTITGVVTSLVGDGTGGFVIPNNATSAVGIQPDVFNIDLRGRKRYLKLSVTPIASGGQKVEATAILSRGNTAASTATLANAAVLVNV